MRKLFAVFLIAATATASANEISYRSLQSDSFSTPLHDHGLHGEGQIIAILDTGLDWRSCYFAEPDGSPPPINTGSPANWLDWQNIDLSRRKVVAYDFLYSCDQYPGYQGCDDPRQLAAAAFDNQDHGTHAAGSAAGDKGVPIEHDYGDAIATGAKLVIQDGGYIGGDNCAQRPGFGCPVQMLPILDQAYKQGVRIHSNSWGDRQNTPPGLNPPTANYSPSARDVDTFVYAHPDMLVVFNTGNFGSQGAPPPSSLSAPGSAKNTLQVGGTRGYAGPDDNVIAGYSLIGPTRDGRIKPDVVGPAYVIAADAQILRGRECDLTDQGGTSWSSPTIAGAAALVRQYYTEGFYPTGARAAVNAFTPSAALLKATIIAAARPASSRYFPGRPYENAQPVPSFEQGFGFPVLDNALYFAGDKSALRVSDIPIGSGLAQGQSTSSSFNVRAGSRFRVVVVWTDPPGTARSATDPTPVLVNDLDLRVVTPAGETMFGNELLHRGQADRLNNVEVVSLDTPASGAYTVTVSANRIGSGPRQGYALVTIGDIASPQPPQQQSTRRRAVKH